MRDYVDELRTLATTIRLYPSARGVVSSEIIDAVAMELSRLRLLVEEQAATIAYLEQVAKQ